MGAAQSSQSSQSSQAASAQLHKALQIERTRRRTAEAKLTKAQQELLEALHTNTKLRRAFGKCRTERKALRPYKAVMTMPSAPQTPLPTR